MVHSVLKSLHWRNTGKTSFLTNFERVCIALACPLSSKSNFSTTKTRATVGFAQSCEGQEKFWRFQNLLEVTSLLRQYRLNSTDLAIFRFMYTREPESRKNTLWSSETSIITEVTLCGLFYIILFKFNSLPFKRKK